MTGVRKHESSTAGPAEELLNANGRGKRDYKNMNRTCALVMRGLFTMSGVGNTLKKSKHFKIMLNFC